MEKIKTDGPIGPDRKEITRDIANFWDKTTLAVRLIWGPHIHHGYFETYRETPVEAQEKLMEKLAALMNISPHDKILDAGCGMGGSSLYLAKRYSAKVTGITLSQKQVDIATSAAREDQIQDVVFKAEDALSMESFSENTFDIVWSLESCEQFYDKELFIRQAFRVLKPGGSLMLATWCSGAEEYDGAQAKKYMQLCISLQLPYMPTINRYTKLLQQQGFVIRDALNWAPHVEKSWDIGLTSLRAHSLFKLFTMSGWRGLYFRKQAKLMQEGFAQHRIEYGVFSAHKPYK
jgi:tocopherol O-methyltransferase